MQLPSRRTAPVRREDGGRTGFGDLENAFKGVGDEPGDIAHTFRFKRFVAGNPNFDADGSVTTPEADRHGIFFIQSHELMIAVPDPDGHPNDVRIHSEVMSRSGSYKVKDGDSRYAPEIEYGLLFDGKNQLEDVCWLDAPADETIRLDFMRPNELISRATDWISVKLAENHARITGCVWRFKQKTDGSFRGPSYEFERA